MRFCFLLSIGVLGLLCVSAEVQGDENEPEFGFLEYAQSLSDNGAVLPVQFESTESEIQQPADFGGRADRFASLRTTNDAGELDFSRLSELLRPALPTATNTQLNNQTQLDAYERITGEPIATGVLQTAPLEIVPASTFSLLSVPDVTESMIRGATTPTVQARRRSPIALEPRIRGYSGGQLYVTLDNAFIGPVRNDLDGVLSKVDQSLIASTQVISGPYGLRYGSGFSFIAVDTIPTPRYEDGWENHVRLGTHVRTNGGQTYNTATLLGGGERAGYFANVAYRNGSDYEAGNGLKIPSSYDAFNIFSGVGIDLNDDTRMVTKFSHVNQGETEYAAQFFDVNQMTHYGLTHSIIHQNEQSGFGYRIDGWYNNTSFDGDTSQAGKRRTDFPVLQRVDRALELATGNTGQFLGDVNGDITIAGFRAGINHQFDQETSVAAGTDFRYVQQNINENYDLSQFGIADPLFSTGLPTSEIYDPGLFAEFATGMTDDWNTAIGARLAFDSTRADPNDLRENSNFEDPLGNVNRDLNVSDVLGSFYFTNDLQLTSVWKAWFAVGYAERLPDLTERYSDGLFLSVIQSGFSRLIGNPEVDKERNCQLDARFDGEWTNARIRLGGFHAWIMDYITYEANVIGDPIGARLLQVINTDYATMTGFEGYGELDLSEGFQAFGNLTYLEGTDRGIDQPLSSISPLEGRIGLRWFDVSDENAWGFESGVRMVARQDRLGTLRPVAGGGNTPITLETPTPGFATAYIRGYFSPSDGINFTGGIENLFNKNYLEHLSLRLPATPDFVQTRVLSPGITPYVGVEMEY